MCKRILILFFILAGTFFQLVHAQQPAAISYGYSKQPDTASKSQSTNSIHKIKRDVISAFAGSTGYGVEYRFKIQHHLELAFEASYFDFEKSLHFQLSGEQVNLYPIVQYMQGGITFRYLPFLKKKSHYLPILTPIIKAGLFVRNNSSFFARATSDAILYVGSFELTPEQIGGMSVYINTKKILPYAGLGFDLKPFRLFPLGLAIDGGVFYHGTPKIQLTSDGLYANMKENEAQLNKNIAPFIWYPMIKLSLEYHL